MILKNPDFTGLLERVAGCHGIALKPTIKTIGFLAFFLVVFCHPAVAQNPICQEKIVIGKVPPEAKVFFDQSSAQGLYAIKKIPAFIHRVAVEKAFGNLLRKLGRRCIRLENLWNPEGRPMTVSASGEKDVIEFYNNYDSNEKSYLFNFAGKQNVSILLFWYRMEAEEIMPDVITLSMMLYDLQNNVVVSKFINFNKRQWIKDRDNAAADIVTGIEEAVTEIKYVISQGYSE